MRCGTVAGDDAATLMPLVEQANQLTPWTSDGSQYGLTVPASPPRRVRLLRDRASTSTGPVSPVRRTLFSFKA